MEKNRASELLEKYQRGECTPEEERILFKAFNRVPLLDKVSLSDEAYEELENASLSAIRRKIARKNKRIVLLKTAIVAAVLLVFLFVAYLFRFDADQADGNMMASQILPGGNRALLSIGGSEPLQLDSNQSTIILDGTHLVYADNTPIKGIPSRLEALGEDIVPLILTTPAGGTYQVTLSDGSRVWLNAASTLKYPSRFATDERTVEISGEAYFSVTKDHERPFRVISNGQEIEVLGTEFNVSAYGDEKETTTTLITGAVRLHIGTIDEFISLVPGEQVVSKEGSITKQAVDTESVTAWKNGNFKLNGSLQHIMAQVGRWYDIEVVFQRDVDAGMELVGEISRDVKLSDILRMISEIDEGLKFRIDEVVASSELEKPLNKRGRRLTVMR